MPTRSLVLEPQGVVGAPARVCDARGSRGVYCALHATNRRYFQNPNALRAVSTSNCNRGGGGMPGEKSKKSRFFLPSASTLHRDSKNTPARAQKGGRGRVSSAVSVLPPWSAGP